ncbi:MAG: Spy/CpxP family protein refolding chaperone [Nitrospinae bacterium]|nr:Spy/CpxP family protein refolding chaperone [Nitrospinota bacterium]
MRKLIVAMAMLILIPAVAVAQGMGGGMGGGPGARKGPGGMDFIQELNLTNEQTTAIRDMRNVMRRKHAEIKGRLEVKEIDFEEELQKDKPNPKALDKIIDEISAIHGQMHKARLELQVKIMGILTPEQKHKMNDRMKMGLLSEGRRGPGGMSDDQSGPGANRPAGGPSEQ